MTTTEHTQMLELLDPLREQDAMPEDRLRERSGLDDEKASAAITDALQAEYVETDVDAAEVTPGSYRSFSLTLSGRDVIAQHTPGRKQI